MRVKASDLKPGMLVVAYVYEYPFYPPYPQPNPPLPVYVAANDGSDDELKALLLLEKTRKYSHHERQACFMTQRGEHRFDSDEYEVIG